MGSAPLQTAVLVRSSDLKSVVAAQFTSPLPWIFTFHEWVNDTIVLPEESSWEFCQIVATHLNRSGPAHRFYSQRFNPNFYRQLYKFLEKLALASIFPDTPGLAPEIREIYRHIPPISAAFAAGSHHCRPRPTPIHLFILGYETLPPTIDDWITAAKCQAVYQWMPDFHGSQPDPPTSIAVSNESMEIPTMARWVQDIAAKTTIKSWESIALMLPTVWITPMGQALSDAGIPSTAHESQDYPLVTWIRNFIRQTKPTDSTIQIISEIRTKIDHWMANPIDPHAAIHAGYSQLIENRLDWVARQGSGPTVTTAGLLTLAFDTLIPPPAPIRPAGVRLVSCQHLYGFSSPITGFLGMGQSEWMGTVDRYFYPLISDALVPILSTEIPPPMRSHQWISSSIAQCYVWHRVPPPPVHSMQPKPPYSILPPKFPPQPDSGLSFSTDDGREIVLSKTRRISVTQLENYQLCPYRFLMESIIGITIDPPRDDGPAAHEWGSLVHRIIHHFWTWILDNPIVFIPDNQTQLGDKLWDFAERELATVFPPIYRTIYRQILVGNSESPGILAKFLDATIATGATPVATELSVSATGPGWKLDTTELVGKIDAIMHIPPNWFVIVDYKTGSTIPGPADIRNFFHLQLPVYSLMATPTLAPDYTWGGGQIFHLRSADAVAIKPVLIAGSAKTDLAIGRARPHIADTAYFADLIDHVENTIATLQSGQFEWDTPISLPLRKKRCRSCPVKWMCRYPGRYDGD